MAIDFPNTPTTNQIYTVGSRSWKWDGTIWAIYSNNPVLYRQDSPPSSPQEGDQWFETDTGRMFVYYGTAWVELGNATDVAGALQPSQVTALSAVTTLTSDDVFPVVDGPSGAVASSKITWGNVQSSITSTGTLGSLAVTGDITRGGVSLPRGVIAVAFSTSNVNFGTETTIITAPTFTAVANRYYRITFFQPALYNSAAGYSVMRIKNGGTVLNSSNAPQFNSAEGYASQCQAILTFTAGSTTLTGTCISSNTGTARCSSSSFGFLLVEDIGAA